MAKKGGGVKILLIVLGVLFLIVAIVGGIGAYVAYRTYHKVKDAAASVGITQENLNSLSSDDGPAKELGDPCQYLSKQEVSSAIGATIVEAKSEGEECHYIAKGSASSFALGHVGSMGGSAGSIPSIPGMTAPAEAGSDAEMTALVVVSVEPRGGKFQLKLLKGISNGLAAAGGMGGSVEGIGDEALVMSGNQLLARKGDVLVKFVYTSCPCSQAQIVPLAKKVIAKL